MRAHTGNHLTYVCIIGVYEKPTEWPMIAPKALRTDPHDVSGDHVLFSQLPFKNGGYFQLRSLPCASTNVIQCFWELRMIIDATGVLLLISERGISWTLLISLILYECTDVGRSHAC